MTTPPRQSAGASRTADSPRDQLRKLLSAACDEKADAPLQSAIESLLEQHPELVADYVAYLVTEAQLEQTCGLTVFEGDGRGVWESSNRPSLTGLPTETAPVPLGKKSTPKRSLGGQLAERITRHPSWILAALLLATVTGAITLLVQEPLATVVAASETRLEGGQELEAGQSLGNDWMVLERGSLRLALRDGAMVSIEAPARFRPQHDNRAELAYGAVSVHVPEKAQGFALANRLGTIVDLGTGYRAVAIDQGPLSVHVTQGSVRIESLAGERLDMAVGEVAMVRSDGLLAPTSLRAPIVKGNLRFLADHPDSLGYDAFMQDGVAFAFLESHAVRLRHDLRVDLSAPGRHAKLSGGKSIPAGSTVDCYLIHCAPTSERHEVRGSIRFDGEILGVLCNDDRLNATNATLGTNWTLTCEHPERGAESAPDPNSDLITLSADRRQMAVYFRTMSIDQIRVLVASKFAD